MSSKGCDCVEVSQSRLCCWLVQVALGCGVRLISDQ